MCVKPDTFSLLPILGIIISMEVLLFKLLKKCTCCGRLHECLPDDVRVLYEGDKLDGFYWECSCQSTMFYPMGMADLIQAEEVV